MILARVVFHLITITIMRIISIEFYYKPKAPHSWGFLFLLIRTPRKAFEKKVHFLFFRGWVDLVMEKIQIIYPMFPLVFLTLFSLAHYNRVFSREHKNDNIKSEWFRLYKGELPDSAIMVREHYKNLFELPIFFFLLCIILYLLDRVESIDVILAWIFVFFKILHSFVRLTTNNTRKRAYSFTICYFALLFGWIHLVFKLIVY